MLSRKSIASGFLLAALVCASSAHGDTGSLAQKLPGGGNLIVTVDVPKFISSPLAAYQGWENKDPGKFPRTPNPLPDRPGLQQIVVTQLLDSRTGQPTWEAGVVQLENPVDLPTVAKNRGGYMDTIEGKQMAVTRGDIFFIDLGDNTIGVTTPADRRFAAQWIRKPGGLSDYLRGAAGQGDVPVVLAMDLSDTISQSAALRMLQDDGPVSAAGIDNGAAAKVISGVKGFVAKISLGDGDSNQQASVKCSLDFSDSPQVIAPMVKDLVIDILKNRALYISDIEKWEFAVTGNSITATGPLSVNSLSSILTLVHAPSPMEKPAAVAAAEVKNDEAAKVDAATPKQVSQTDKIAASQKYYKTISSMIDLMKPGPSLKDSAGYLMSDARRIEQMPILNVDPDLVQWGMYISSTFRQAGTLFAGGQQRTTAAVAGIQKQYTTYDNNNWAGNTANELQAAQDSRNTSLQRRQAAANERAQIIDQVSKPLQDAADSRAKVRLMMVQRYNVEF